MSADYVSLENNNLSISDAANSTDRELKRKENRTETENLDFEVAENKLHEKKLAVTTKQEFEREARIKWVIAFVIATITGAIAVAANSAIKGLHSIKFDTTDHFVHKGDHAGALFTFMFFNLGYIMVATLLVSVLEPKAKGSGIPEIKSVLNGRRIHRVIALRTLISKVTGIIFAVGAGAFVGKEGPMIHTGAIVGALTSQGRPEILKYQTYFPWLSYFRNDNDASEFIGMGAAAGVAAAFGAPIGGVLFAIEEAATFWSSPLTWRSFFCTMTATLVVYWVRDMGSNTWSMTESGLVSFGSFEGASKDASYPTEVSYTLYEVFIFLLMGVACGLLGALFNGMNEKISKLRRKYILTKRRKVMEALFVTALTSVMIFVCGWATSCQTLPPESQQNLELEQFFCKDGEWNDMATLVYSPLDETVKMLFHSMAHFRINTLLIFATLFYLMTCLTYGTNIPSGLFVPSILFGSIFGRIIGQLMQNYTSVKVDPGLYAFIGGGAFLGGVTRATISIVVIMIECTQNQNYSIPLMVTIMSAKLVGDIFNHGLYDIHVRLQKIPFLEYNPTYEMEFLTAADVMTPNVVTFNQVEKVSHIVQVLTNTKHNGFPVISRSDPNMPGIFEGIILRSQLVILLKLKAFTGSSTTKKFNKDKLRRRRMVGFVTPEVPPSPTLKRNSSALAPLLPDQQTDSDSESSSSDEEDLNRLASYPNLRGSSSMKAPHSPGINDPRAAARILKQAEFERFYPKYPEIHQVVPELVTEELDLYVDLTPYMNGSSLSVHHTTRMTRVYDLFRRLGIRHLTIVNSTNNIVGIITRVDILPERCKELYDRKISLRLSRRSARVASRRSTGH